MVTTAHGGVWLLEEVLASFSLALPCIYYCVAHGCAHPFVSPMIQVLEEQCHEAVYLLACLFAGQKLTCH